jgi:glycosyltransferase involved in cell wall biosynthesis
MPGTVEIPSPPRLAVVISHPTQYYSPWFRWLHRHAPLTTRVFYLSDFGLKPAHDEKFQTSFAWDVDLTSGYDWELVPNTAERPDTLRHDGLRNPELPTRLKAWRPDAILLFGYNYHTHLRLIAWARLQGIPLIFRGDSHLLGRPRPGFAKRALLSFLYAQFSAIACVGAANRDYFRFFRVREDRLFFAPHAVNAAHFDPSRPELRAAASALRLQLGIPAGTRVILFAGKLIAQKQPAALLEAYLGLGDRASALVFVGDGPEKTALQETAARHLAGSSVHFLPFANQSEMPSRYLLADLFVLPSRGGYETWGLAINEAMHLGVPCLVSDHVGCQRDLVSDGETGWVFSADAPGTLRPKLVEALAAIDRNREELRAAVTARIAHYTYAQSTAGLVAAVNSLRPRRIGSHQP